MFEDFTVKRKGNTIILDSATCQERIDATNYPNDSAWRKAVMDRVQVWIQQLQMDN